MCVYIIILYGTVWYCILNVTEFTSFSVYIVYLLFFIHVQNLITTKQNDQAKGKVLSMDAFIYSICISMKISTIYVVMYFLNQVAICNCKI